MSATPAADTVSAVVLRDFKDAGTEESFTADATIELEPGRFRNFQHAGLVRAADAGEPSAD